MRIGALVSAVALSGGLVLTGAGTAQAIRGNFDCVMVDTPSPGIITSTTCQGGPLNATSGTVQETPTQTTYRCPQLRANKFSDDFLHVSGNGCIRI